MAIIQTVQFNDFQDAFRAYNRMDNFSREGLELLFDHLESYSEDAGKDIELDVVALCCDYTEQSSEDIIKEYRVDFDADNDDEDDIAREYLENNTTIVGETSTGFIFANF